MAHGHDCLPPSTAPVLEKSHIHTVRNAQEAQEQFVSIYNDPRRLRNEHDVPDFFITNLKNHLLQALENNYADFLYYADLGHLHLLIPDEQKELSFESENLLSLFHTGELYLFKKPGKIFGPLTTQDPHWEWLYWHRNFVGKNQLGEPLIPLRAPANAAYNTVRHIEGYKEVGTVYFSANKNGCYHLKSTTVDLRFDISVVF
jgi:hypothetical protein